MTPPDLIEVNCEHCKGVLETDFVPREEFMCSWCGATLRPQIITVVQRVATSVVVEPPIDPDDVTPVASAIPLRRPRTDPTER